MKNALWIAVAPSNGCAGAAEARLANNRANPAMNADVVMKLPIAENKLLFF
jgi:hypothetical protein